MRIPLSNLLKSPAGIGLAATTSILVAAGIFIRFFNLSWPAKRVFDEVYFPVFAGNYLTGTPFYDVHPPLGKFAIALGMWLFGDTTIGWRIMPAVAGVALVFVMGWLAWRLTQSAVAGLLLAIFVAIDGMAIAYSRVGLMDGILMLTIFLAVLASVCRPRQLHWFWLALGLGAAAAIKWPAIAVAVPMYWYCRRQGTELSFLASLPLAVVIYFAITMTGFMLTGATNPFMETLSWHQSAFNYHATITATHPWGSPWWSWPLLLKPVLLVYDRASDGSLDMLHIMTTLGNPVLWWVSGITVVMSLVDVVRAVIKRRQTFWEHPLVPLLLGYFAFWLPWALVDRVVFLYHFFPSYGFALLMLAYWLSAAWQRGWRFLTWMVLGLAVAVALAYLPWAVGWWAVPADYPVLLRGWMS